MHARLLRIARLYEQQVTRLERAESAHAQTLAARARASHQVALARAVWEVLAERTCHASVRELEEGREPLVQAQRELRAREVELQRWDREANGTLDAVRRNALEAQRLEALRVSVAALVDADDSAAAPTAHQLTTRRPE